MSFEVKEIITGTINSNVCEETMKNDYKNFDPIACAMEEAKQLLMHAANKAIADGVLPDKDGYDFVVEIPGDHKNGDIASNIALVGARTFGMPPRAIAQAIVDNINTDGIFNKVELAGPGFINLFLNPSWFGSVLIGAITSGEDYGKTNFGKGEKINVEFVSANPTGPMHLGNARGGALGDCLAEAMNWAGYDAHREFYINDAGNQIVKFGKSLATRYMQIFEGEEKCPLPEDCYQGADIKVLAQKFADIHGDAYVSKDFEELSKDIIDFALPQNIADLKTDLAKYRISYDTWFHESTLYSDNDVQKMLDVLASRGATYEKDGAIWYKSTEYSAKYGANRNARKGQDGEVTDEDKDEVLVRANGIPTYFAADIAYHYNKMTMRNFERCVNVWGADHHGHVARMKGAMDAIGLDGEKLDIVLMQFVRLLQGGEPVRMSKRTGKAITLTDLLDEVPIDSARFFFNLREAGSVMDFDLDLAVKEDSDNPVYYVQYAHARICSILKKLESENITFEGWKGCNGELYTEENERALIRLIANMPQEIISAAKNYEPARLTRYVIEVATQFHKFYNSCRVKDTEHDLCQARLGLCVATRIVIRNVLTMLKVTIPESM